KKSAVGLGKFTKKSFLYPIHYIISMIQPMIAQPMIYFLMLVRIFAELVLWILNTRFPTWMFNGTALKDLSATCMTIFTRIWLYIYLIILISLKQIISTTN